MNKRRKRFTIIIIAVSIAIALVASVAIVLKGFPNFGTQKTHVESTRVSNVEFADPYEVLTKLKKGSKSFIIVDIRSKKAFAKAHLKHTHNVPYTSNEGHFIEKVTSVAKGKQVVLLPHSHYSTQGAAAFHMLAHKNVDVSVLHIGWNELYNLPNIWLPEDEWSTFEFQDMIEHAE